MRARKLSQAGKRYNLVPAMVDTGPQFERFVIGQRRALVVPLIARQQCEAAECHGRAGGVTDRAKQRECLLRVRAELAPEAEGLLIERPRFLPPLLGLRHETEQVDG